MKRELGQFERAQVMTGEKAPFNLVVVLRLENGPSIDTLKTALDLLKKCHPLLGVRVAKEKNRYFFVPGNAGSIPLTVVGRRDDQHWQDAVEAELNCPIEMFAASPGVLARVVYLYQPPEPDPGNGEIVLTFQHSVADGASLASLLHDLLDLCRAIDRRDSEFPGFELMEPFPPADKMFPPPFRGIRLLARNMSFMFRQMTDEMKYRRRSRGKRRAPVRFDSPCKILARTMDSDTTKALSRAARQEKTTLNNLLNAAVLIAVHRRFYNDQPMPLRHFNFNSLRPYLSPPPGNRYLGSYFSMMRYTVSMSPGDGIWDLARRFGDMAHKAFKRRDVFCSNWLSPMMMKTILRSSMRMGNTALSFTGPLELEENYGKTGVRRVHAFVSNFGLGPEFAAQARVFRGELIWDIIYMVDDMDQQTAERLCEDIFELLAQALPKDNVVQR